MHTRNLTLLLCAMLSPALAQDAAPSAESLIRAAIAAEKAQETKGLKFTFREDEDKLPTDKNGKPLKPEHFTYDNVMLEGDNYRKLILIEGKPPDAKLQRKIDAEMDKERAARRAHPVGTGRHEVNFGGLDFLARSFDSKVAGEEMVSGRMTWRMESTPKVGYKPANHEEEKAMGARRVTWFDREDGALVKDLASFIRPTAGFMPGSEFELEFGRHEGAWLPDRLVLRYNAKMLAVVQAHGETRKRFYDYKKFEVESKIVDQ